MPNTQVAEADIWKALEAVMDPEIPSLSVVDLGIITKIELTDNRVQITMTPTFVGCPAIDVMKKDIRNAAEDLGLETEVLVDFDKPWTSNMMSEEGRKKLEDFGLAPPPHIKAGEVTAEDLDKVRCPHCKSTDTTLNTPFGSTLCRAIRFCFNCKQGFEQFKPV